MRGGADSNSVGKPMEGSLDQLSVVQKRKVVGEVGFGFGEVNTIIP